MFLDTLKRIIRETDKWLLLLCVSLSAFGTLMVSSATRRSLEDGELMSRDGKVMIIALILGLFICLVISFIDYDLIYKLRLLIAVGLILFMLSLFVIGVSPEGRDDAISWIKVGKMYIQPSEFLKIGFIITFSYHLNKVKKDISDFKNIFFLCLHALIPIALVVVTGDMGSALIFVLMFIGMMFVSGVHWAYFPAGLVLVGAAAPVLWYKVFDDIQRNRILALLRPEDFSTEIYQQQQAINAMKNGGFLGTGLFKGDYTQSGSIPVDESDMIFSVICEELGFVGALVLLVLFVLLAVRIVYVGKRSHNFASAMMCYGVMFMIISQVIINIGMCSMLLPVIGITLPFVSSGGSSILSTYLAIGLVLSVYRSSSGIAASDRLYALNSESYRNAI